MKKVLSLIAALTATVSLMAQTTYTKVTSTPEDWTGTYLIVCEAEKVVFNGAADSTCIDSISGPAVIQNITFPEDGKLTADLDSATFTISKTENTDWPWAIKSASGLYIGHKDADDNGLSAELELKSKCMQTLSIDANGNFIAVAQWTAEGAGKAFNLQYNNAADQMRFRYYKSDKKLAVQIYKKCESTAINVVNTSANKNEGIEKCIANGKMMIIKDGKKYSISGVQL